MKLFWPDLAALKLLTGVGQLNSKLLLPIKLLFLDWNCEINTKKLSVHTYFKKQVLMGEKLDMSHVIWTDAILGTWVLFWLFLKKWNGLYIFYQIQKSSVPNNSNINFTIIFQEEKSHHHHDLYSENLGTCSPTPILPLPFEEGFPFKINTYDDVDEPIFDPEIHLQLEMPGYVRVLPDFEIMKTTPDIDCDQNRSQFAYSAPFQV